MSTKESEICRRNINKSKSTPNESYESEDHIANQLKDPLHCISNGEHDEDLVAKDVDRTQSLEDIHPILRSTSVEKPKSSKTTTESPSVQTTVYTHDKSYVIKHSHYHYNMNSITAFIHFYYIIL